MKTFAAEHIPAPYKSIDAELLTKAFWIQTLISINAYFPHKFAFINSYKNVSFYFLIFMGKARMAVGNTAHRRINIHGNIRAYRTFLNQFELTFRTDSIAFL